MTLAVHFQNEKIQVSRAGQSELVLFDGRDHLPTEFTVTTDAVRPVTDTTARDTHRTLKLHVEDDGMQIRLTGEKTDNRLVNAVLCGLFEAIREENSDSTDLVIVGAENTRLQQAATDLGFSAAFISPAEAAIRWAGADAHGTVAVLFCHQDGSIAWEYAIFNDEGAYTRNSGGQFAPTDPTRIDQIDHGFGKFLVSLQEQEHPVAQIIVTGSGAETEPVTAFLTAMESPQYGYNIVRNANAVVLGASMPPLPSKYSQFDDLIEAAINALSNAEFTKAMEMFEKATSLFESPSEHINQTINVLQHQLRTALLNKKTVEAEPLYEKALALSETEQEKAEVYEGMLNFYGQAGKIADAEAAAITAGFYDPPNEKRYMAVLQTYQDDGDDTPEKENAGGKQASVLLGLISVCEVYFFLTRTLFP